MERATESLFDPLPQGIARIGLIGEDQCQAWEAGFGILKDERGAGTVLDVGRMNHRFQEQTQRIRQKMALPAAQSLVAVIAMDPPFSVVFADWLSMIAALGDASRPAWDRRRSRSLVLIRSQRPLRRQFLK